MNAHLTPVFQVNFPSRYRSGRLARWVFQFSTLLGIALLALLMFTILDGLMGYAAMTDKVSRESLAVDNVPLEALSSAQLLGILQANLSSNAYQTLDNQQTLAELSRSRLYTLVVDRVVKPRVDETWSLTESLFKRDEIFTRAAQQYPDARIEWKFWLNSKFLASAASSDPLQAGVRSALLGSLWTILITILFAFPVGVGAAIYLEEYAADNALNRVLKTNITNLAGVPSIIYGMLGLAIFVRTLQSITSGALFGAADPAGATGRTVLSAGLTLALLVLPLIIINAQEAIRTVPNSLRQASLGLGATKWQTIWHHVLPNAISGILTGAILAISRAIGETAPLVVVGAATFLNFDPNGPFSRFSTLPIQIYQWTSRAQGEFRNLAAAAILLLLVMLLSLNASAILLRNRFRSKI